MQAALIAAEWKDAPEVEMTFKGFVDAIDSSSALGRYGIAAEFMELYRGVSIVGQLMPKLRRVPFTLAVPTESTGASAAWVPEDAPIPVTQIMLGSNLSLPHTKIACISAISSELARSSTPAAERVVRDSLVRAVAAKVIPASRPQPERIRARSQAGMWLLDIPVIRSISSPAQISLIDAADVLIADDGQIQIDFSEQTSLIMDTAPPLGDQSPVTTLPIKSLWQGNMAAFRVIRTISWALGHSTSAVTMSVSY